MARESGHRLYFRVVYYSVLLTLAAAVIVQGLWGLFAWLALANVGGAMDAFGSAGAYSGWLDAAKGDVWRRMVFDVAPNKWPIGMLAFGIGRLVHIPVNTTRERERRISQAIANHDFEQLMLSSFEEKRPVLFTLANGQVYLGWAVSSINPEVERRWVRILPIASGYRREKTHKVTFRVNYALFLNPLSDLIELRRASGKGVDERKPGWTAQCAGMDAALDASWLAVHERMVASAPWPTRCVTAS